MKKIILFLISVLLVSSSFAQTTVEIGDVGGPHYKADSSHKCNS